MPNRESTLLVQISDQGSGVDPVLAPHIFDAWVSNRDASIAGGLVPSDRVHNLTGNYTELITRLPHCADDLCLRAR